MGELNFMPHIVVGDQVLNVLRIDLAIDFGGRQADVEFQDTDTLETTDATYFYLAREWNRVGWPTDDTFTQSLHQLFDQFAEDSPAISDRDAEIRHLRKELEWLANAENVSNADRRAIARSALRTRALSNGKAASPNRPLREDVKP